MSLTGFARIFRYHYFVVLPDDYPSSAASTPHSFREQDTLVPAVYVTAQVWRPKLCPANLSPKPILV